MELSYDRCPRCGAEFRGARCEACAKTASIPPRRPAPSLRPEPARVDKVVWGVRIFGVLLASVLLGTCYSRCGERPSFLALRTDVDGPSLSSARKVLVFLHGYGGSIGSMDWLPGALRKAKLPDDVAVVLVEAPYSAGFGRTWGDDAAQEAKSIERLRALLESSVFDRVPPGAVVVAGFSQGAGVAADLAAEENRVETVASLSACRFRAKSALLERKSLHMLLAHGKQDSVCSVGQSRQLADELRSAGHDVRFVEFAGDHTIPDEVIDALVKLVSERD